MSFPDIFRILQVAFGIGMVIFVHEGGHFLAARWCGVRVEVFSLGFGPKLVGWRRGHTLYQIAAVPFGGYVRMAGEIPDGTGRAPRADELGSKSVAQRFFIYSGGVLMNVVFALVFFPIVLMAGVPSISPMVDEPVKGTPAWHARVPASSRVVSINGKSVFDFSHIVTEVAIGGSDPVVLEILPPGARDSQLVELQPEKDENVGFYRVGLAADYDSHLALSVQPGSATAEAGVLDGDRLRGVPGALAALPPERQLAAAVRAGGPVTMLLERVDEHGGSTQLELTVTPRLEQRAPSARVFGILTRDTLVADLRRGPEVRALGIEPLDVVVRVGARPIVRASDFLALVLECDDVLQLEVQRGAERVVLESSALSDAQAVALESDLAFAPELDGTVLHVQEGCGAWEAGMRSGDRVVAIDGEPVSTWAEIKSAAGAAAAGDDELAYTVERDGALLVFRARAATDHLPVYGLGLRNASYIYRTHGLGESVAAGALASWRFLTDAWLTLKKMLKAEVSPKHLGGIITISKVSYDVSGMGWQKLLFFLCMLSVNLALLNVLPIPVLDGGHLFFLLVEAVKGSPVSERTLGYSQIVGLVLILSLMVYVTYNDILRLIPGT
jgi:regulator of sigma E protease